MIASRLPYWDHPVLAAPDEPRPPARRVARLGTTDITTTPGWWAVLALVAAVAAAGLLDSAVFAMAGGLAIVYLAHVGHELAHAWAAVHHGHPVEEIRYAKEGTLVRADTRRPYPPRHLFWIAGAGPAVTVTALAGCLITGVATHGWLRDTCGYAVLCLGVIAVGDLVPHRGRLDGRRLLSDAGQIRRSVHAARTGIDPLAAASSAS